MKKINRVTLCFVLLNLFFNSVNADNISDNLIKKQKSINNYYYSTSGLNSSVHTRTPDDDDSVIYDQDDRKDLYQLDASKPDQSLQVKLAKSVCLLTNADNVKLSQNKVILEVADHDEFGLQSCPHEPFAKQKIGGWCTGFLVAPDVVATAGHCIKNDADAKNTSFIFGFSMVNKNNQRTTFEKNQVYYGKKVLKHALTAEGEDYALVQLSEKVTVPGSIPLKVRSNGSANVNDFIGVIGHPSGLPLKISYGQSRVLELTPSLYRTNLDTYGGNSGSPVFNQDGIVEGILVRGNSDYKIDQDAQCFHSVRLSSKHGSEMVTRAAIFAKYINSAR